MAKKSDTQRLIDDLEYDKATIQRTIDLLKSKQSNKPARVRKAKPAPVADIAEARR